MLQDEVRHETRKRNGLGSWEKGGLLDSGRTAIFLSKTIFLWKQKSRVAHSPHAKLRPLEFCLAEKAHCGHGWLSRDLSGKHAFSLLVDYHFISIKFKIIKDVAGEVAVAFLVVGLVLAEPVV